ncbi:MAG TPA: aminotransferase class III-fold pyridoxal phosphate-dependent enzyme [Longimicrobiales bacterium]|nr:aminotransferase class III-fold pyridoxal phosphate-dependent enzyme [Longimicrobiales bacterium]
MASAPETLAAGPHRPPRFTADDALRIARDVFGVVAVAAEPLPSERDQNFRLRDAAGGDLVLKLSQTGEDPGILECQNAMLERLAAAGGEFRFPRARRALSGRLIETVTAPVRPSGGAGEWTSGGNSGAALGAGAASAASPALPLAHSPTPAVTPALPLAHSPTPVHHVRLLDFLPGIPLAELRPHAPALLEDVGRMLGVLDRALAGFDHPAAHRELHWDLCRGSDVVRRHLPEVDDARRRALVERSLARVEEHLAPLRPRLRRAVVHGDGNDWNVLVAPGSDPLEPARAVGIVDFGDVVHSWTAAEPAIAAAYAMMGKRDPLAAAAHLVRGYHAEHPLEEAEIEALFPLITLRVCTSVVLAAHQRRLRPENTYLSVSERGAWALLEQLAAIHPRLAHYLLRGACGVEPHPRSKEVVAWLEAQASGIGPAPPLPPSPTLVFDLSVGSLETAGLSGRDGARAWTDLLFGQMRDAGATLGLGRWDEPRSWYTEPAFRVDTDDGPEWRTVHIGVDLFATPGTPVLAPLDGVVHAVRDNAGRLDYGPTVVLRHDAGGVPFFTLYGHLSPECLDALAPGQAVARGERIGAIGDFPGNGDWAPHLHLQLVLDMLDRDGEFPGVARPSQRNVWRSLSPDPNLLLRFPELRPASTPTADELLSVRRERIGPSLSVSYRRPLHIVRGWMQHLYDDAGRGYLDCVNNVAHVGHSHPRVVDALARQARVLNTNTRYLHESLLRYAERLTATLPEPLRVCFFVCSGSEANELALRLARTHTRRSDVVVLDAAYHGNTTSLVGISPYKFDGPGGAGRPPGTHVVPLPDPYRGPYRGEDAGRRYAEHVLQATRDAERAGRGVAAFFAEPLPGCGGQIVPPDGFLAEAFRHVRAAGGVAVADEVQVGFGRAGSHFWAFQADGAVPDIVTMGKPIGNGHPLGAVVTTPEIAGSFANGMEYFNTFGGNPVSCAVGLAVLDVIEQEELQERARRVGARLLDGLRGLMARHDLVGDVRGRGLYLGVELVTDRDAQGPAPRHASYVVERMRDRGILLSTDGPLHNVIKIKPPLQFSEEDADRVVAELDEVLGETALAKAGGGEWGSG